MQQAKEETLSALPKDLEAEPDGPGIASSLVPKRQPKNGYKEPERVLNLVPEVY
jgi:hypothetical protein